MVDAFDLLAEARWEQEGIRRATQRYREAAAVADPSTLPSGQKLLREVVPALAAKIGELQVEGLRRETTRGQGVRWSIPIQLLDPNTLAVITIISAMNAGRDTDGSLASVLAISLSIASAVRAEVDYRQWIEEQEAANKAAKAARDWDHVDLVAAFKRQYPEADRKTWRKFRTKLGLAKAEPWDKETNVQLGAALIHALVAAAPDRFEIDRQQIDGGRQQNRLKLSAKTMELMNDVEARAEVARPMLMPMIIPPIPWSYTDAR